MPPEYLGYEFCVLAQCAVSVFILYCQHDLYCCFFPSSSFHCSSPSLTETLQTSLARAVQVGEARHRFVFWSGARCALFSVPQFQQHEKVNKCIIMKCQSFIKFMKGLILRKLCLRCLFVRVLLL